MISVKNLTLNLPIFDDRAYFSLNRSLFNSLNIEKKKIKIRTVLDGITFNLDSNSSLALIGKNGSGKTSLLRCIMGIYSTYSGTITKPEKIASFLDLNSTVDNELTGVENIYLLIRLVDGKKIIKNEMDKIIEFSGLKQQIFDSVRTYSSGMKARLIFSASTFFYKKCILLDEHIFVGDFDFQQRVKKKLDDLKKEGSSIILATHSDDIAKAYCDYGLLLKDGKQIDFGNINKIIEIYRKS